MGAAKKKTIVILDHALTGHHMEYLHHIYIWRLQMMEPETHREFSERAGRQYLKISERQERDLEGVIDYILN